MRVLNDEEERKEKYENNKSRYSCHNKSRKQNVNKRSKQNRTTSKFNNYVDPGQCLDGWPPKKNFAASLFDFQHCL
jgi:hypothetical protein